MLRAIQIELRCNGEDRTVSKYARCELGRLSTHQVANLVVDTVFDEWEDACLDLNPMAHLEADADGVEIRPPVAIVFLHELLVELTLFGGNACNGDFAAGRHPAGAAVHAADTLHLQPIVRHCLSTRCCPIHLPLAFCLTECLLAPSFSIIETLTTFLQMSQHPSFKKGAAGAMQKRNVLTRFERVDLLKKRKELYRFTWGDFCLPHDIVVQEMGSGLTRLRSLKNLMEGQGVANWKTGIQMRYPDTLVPIRQALPRCWFDGVRAGPLVRALKSYHRKYDEKKRMYMDKPDHGWESHPVDAAREMSIYCTRGQSSGDQERINKHRREHRDRGRAA